MSAHVLLNLLNEFNKFNITRARMLDSIYHMTNTLKSHYWHKNVIKFCHYNVVMDLITFPVNL